MALYGWIIYNGFLKSDKFVDFAVMLQEAALERGHEAEIKTNVDVLNVLHHDGSNPIYDRLPDYVLFTDKDIYLANTLERLGVNVFNRSRAIEVSDDKIKTYEHLAAFRLPIPLTIVAPKTFGQPLHVRHPYIRQVLDQLSFPFIVKEAFGSFGEQVHLVHDEDELANCLEKIGGSPFVFQEFIEESRGVDLRLQVVGEEVVASMKRISETDFRANVTAGSRMEPYEPNEWEKRLAVQATKAIGAHFAGVDLLFGKDGERYICEVNSNAHIRNLYDCTNIDASYDIIKLVERELKS